MAKEGSRAEVFADTIGIGTMTDERGKLYVGIYVIKDGVNSPTLLIRPTTGFKIALEIFTVSLKGLLFKK